MDWWTNAELLSIFSGSMWQPTPSNFSTELFIRQLAHCFSLLARRWLKSKRLPLNFYESFAFKWKITSKLFSTKTYILWKMDPSKSHNTSSPQCFVLFKQNDPCKMSSVWRKPLSHSAFWCGCSKRYSNQPTWHPVRTKVACNYSKMLSAPQNKK